MWSVICSSIAISWPYRNSNGISQVKMHRLALKIQTCLKCLLRLFLLAAQAIVLTIFNEMRTDFDKGKGHLTFLALFVQSQHPIKVAGPCPFVVLTTADNLLDDSLLQIGLQAYGTNQWSTHNAFVLERQIPKQRQLHIALASGRFCGREWPRCGDSGHPYF